MSGGASTAWSWRHAVTKSDLPATTRHVLLTLSVYMDGTGRSCFPSITDLVEATGLSNRTVLTHIEAAMAAGWLRVSQHGYRGRRWRRSEYEPLWPERDIEPPGDETESAEGGEGGSPPHPDDVVNLTTRGGEPDDIEVVKEVHHVRDQSIHHSSTSPGRESAGASPGQDQPPDEGAGRPSRAEMLDADWQALRKVWPNMALEAHEPAKAKLAALKAAERRAAIEAVPAFIAHHRAERGKAKLPYLVNYLGEMRWQDLPKPSAPAMTEPTTVRINGFTRAWWWIVYDAIRRSPATIGERDSAAGQALLRMFGAAVSRIGHAVRADTVPEIEEAARHMVQLHVESGEFAAWRGHVYRTYGVTLPVPDAVAWVWAPAGDPAQWGADEAAGDEDAA